MAKRINTAGEPIDDEEDLPTPWRNARKAMNDEMASRGRAPSVSGDYMTRPGAAKSPYSATGGLTPGVTGLTPEQKAVAGSTWNDFFAPSRASTMARNTSLLPSVPADAVAMEQQWRNTILGKPTSAPAVPSVADYLKAGVAANTSFYARYGRGINPVAGRVQAGTSFRGPYGTGSVDTPSNMAMKYPLTNDFLSYEEFI